ncbi:MAG TPA: hypothetical protein VMF03_15255 [Steroidobacteraceae bacterium]|nr:hypothetical protein [Steroidobacteraceae bacterium]
MHKLYILEVASVLMAAVLLVADCRQMTMRTPGGTSWTHMQVTSEFGYRLAPQAAGVERTDVMRQVSGLSLLASASAARASHRTAQR